MATIFTRIIDGDLPGHFVWRDEHCVALLSINPLTTAHILVVPIAEVDHWIDLDPDVNTHLMRVSQQLGRALDAVYSPPRIGLIVAGYEVPHVHIHVFASTSMADFDFRNAADEVDHEELASIAAAIRQALEASGATGVSAS